MLGVKAPNNFDVVLSHSLSCVVDMFNCQWFTTYENERITSKKSNSCLDRR